MKAVSLWEQAAAQGFTVAWYDLGGAYQKGWGVPNADAVCAYAFFSVAADDGFAPAASLRGHLAAKLTADELAEGQRLAREAKARLAEGGLLTHCPSQPVILEFTAIDVQELLPVFTSLTGFEFTGEEGLVGTVTLDAEYPDWRAALTAALQQVGRRWERRGDNLHVLPAASP